MNGQLPRGDLDQTERQRVALQAILAKVPEDVQVVVQFHSDRPGRFSLDSAVILPGMKENALPSRLVSLNIVPISSATWRARHTRV
jgi:hypothetical protein